MTAILQELPVEWLQRGQYQPRETFNTAALNELAQSIRSEGLIEPIVVREILHQRYEIIAGERRWRAAKMIGLTHIPCIIGQYTDVQTAAITLVENIQREDLNVIEEALAYLRLQQEFHFNQQEIATLVGKSRSHITNILRLLTLSVPVKERLKSNLLSLGHARALVGLPAIAQETFARRVEHDGLSVRQLEKQVRENKYRLEKKAPSPPKNVSYLETRLAEQLGTPVKIMTDSNEGGTLTIKFFDNDTLLGLLEKMGLGYD